MVQSLTLAADIGTTRPEAHAAFGHRWIRLARIVNHSELKMNGDISVGSVWIT
jgi:hypothetical protein